MKAAKLLLTAACTLCLSAAFAQTAPAGQGTSTSPTMSTAPNEGTSMQAPMNDNRMTQGTTTGSGKMAKSDGMKHKGMKHKTSMSDGSGKMKTKM